MGEYADARITQGFKDLLEHLRGEDQPNHAAVIRANTEARAAAVQRVRREYAEVGMVPPSDLALSITARLAFDIGINHGAREAAE